MSQRRIPRRERLKIIFAMFRQYRAGRSSAAIDGYTANLYFVRRDPRLSRIWSSLRERRAKDTLDRLTADVAKFAVTRVWDDPRTPWRIRDRPHLYPELAETLDRIWPIRPRARMNPSTKFGCIGCGAPLDDGRRRQCFACRPADDIKRPSRRKEQRRAKIRQIFQVFRRYRAGEATSDIAGYIELKRMIRSHPRLARIWLSLRQERERSKNPGSTQRIMEEALSFRAPPAMARDVAAYADRHGIGLAEAIRRLVKAGLATSETST